MERGKRRSEKWVNNWRPPERVCTQLSADSPLGPQVAPSLRYCQLERGKMEGGRKAGRGRKKEGGKKWCTERWQRWGRRKCGRKRCSEEWWKTDRTERGNVGDVRRGCRQMRYKTGDEIYCVLKKKKGWWFVFWCFGNCLSTSLLVTHVGSARDDRKDV